MTCLRVLVVAATTLFASVSVAEAQSAQQQNMDRMATMDRQRVANDLTNPQQPVDRRGRKLSYGQVLSAAKNAAKKAELACKVTDAMLLGVTNENSDLFEIACETGPGYIVTNPLQTHPADCTLLASMVESMKENGVTPPPNSSCVLKGNQPAG